MSGSVGEGEVEVRYHYYCSKCFTDQHHKAKTCRNSCAGATIVRERIGCEPGKLINPTQEMCRENPDPALM